MAGRSQHRDNRSSYFSTDLGRSGVYDSVNGTPLNFLQRGDNPNDSRNIEGISETARESGLYASRIGSIKQPTEDYSKEQMLGSTGNFHKQNWDQSFEEGNKTPESGTYSRNIESHQHDMDYKVNNDIGRSSTFDNTRDSGLYSRKIGSFRETISDKDVATPFPENHGLDNQRQSSKSFKPNKYIGNTLDTMLEGEDESKQAEHFSSTNYSESRKYSDTARNGDYDGHSNASFQDDKEFPPWAGMVVDQQFADKYIKTKWPRISLHLTHTRQSDPFVPGKIDEGSIRTIDENNGTDDHRTRNTLCVIGLGTLLLCLVGAAIITIILLANQSTDKTEYVKVNMTVTIDQDFPPELEDLASTKYKIFTSEFCSEIRNVYNSNNSSLDGYYGCKVNSVMNGSIIVTYIIYFTGTTNQLVTANIVETILISHLNVSASQLGGLVIITSSVTVHNVETETLASPPNVEGSATTATTTPLIETTTEVAVPSTVTMSDSETTEATTLKTKQTTVETTSLTTSSTESTTPKTIQSSTETATSTIPPTEDTTAATIQSTTETTSPLISSTEDTTSKTTLSTLEITSASYSPTDETTHTSTQSTGETTTPSVSLTDETAPKTKQSTTEITTPSILSTENTTPKTMLSTKETTSPTITSTEESMSSESTNHVSEETTTLQTSKTPEATQETTSVKTTPAKESIFSTTQEETTTLTTSSTETLLDTTTSDSTERSTTSSSVQLIDDTTKPVISTSTEDTNQIITSTPTEYTTKLITSTPTEDTTRLITSIPTEDTTKHIPSTSTEDTTKLIPSASTEDTTKSTTSTSTEDTTKLITSTSTEDTTKPITSTSTEDTTTPAGGTSTVDTTKSVISTPTEDITQSVTFTSTEDTTKPGTSTPTEDTTKTVSSAPTEDTTPSITATSTEGTSKPVTSTPTEDTTKTVSSTPTEDTTPSTTATSTTSMSTTEMTTSDEITTVSGTTTESQNIGLNCTDSLNGVLYSGPVAIVCTIQTSDQFDYIEIYHGDEANNSIFGILINKDGTPLQNDVENQDIDVEIDNTSTINLSLTFINVSCSMEGFYKVALLRNMSGEMKESTNRYVQLKVSSPAEKPILTLNADQVIDLEFSDGNYFRGDQFMHQCEGYVGHPPSNLEIHITYDNGTNFQTIPNENITLNISSMSNGCRNKELVRFGLRFSQDMVGAKLRCRVKNSIDDYTLSQELSLIPRNICSCGDSGSYRGHPSNCRVQIYCIEYEGKMYPTGIACPSNECRNSITGKCTTNCSNSVCEETVPPDFCTTPAPPTTTQIPSAYIDCNDSTAPLHSGPVDISCILNETTFTMINVTFKSSATSNLVVKATVNNKRNVTYLIPDDNFSISFESDVLTISIKNATCSTDGTYGISVDFNDVIKEEANGKLTISSNPGKPLITLHSDQIVDLGYYRDDRLHTCFGDVGVPPKQLILELVYANGSEFQITGGNIESRHLESGNCQNSETVKFGISFTSEMNGGKVRCSVDGSDANSTKSDIDLALIPRNICSCGKHLDSIGHPQSCYAYVSCNEIEGTVYPFGISCPLEQCRNSITGKCSANCSQAVCSETVPSGFCTTPAPMLPTVAPSRYIQCYGNSKLQFSGKVQIVCVLNQTEFSSINVTFETTEQSNLIAQIASNRTVKMVDTSGKIDVRISNKNVTVELLNASCIDSGLYVVAVDLESERATAQGELYIQTKPDKPTLQVPFHTVENQKTTITCTGNTGSPAGSLQILIKRQNVSDPVTFNISTDSVKVIAKSEICNHEETVTLDEILTSDWNLTTIQCKAVNQETITEEDDSIYYTSEESQIVLIEENYCPTMSTKAEYKYHPKSCNHYVLCSADRMFQLPCPTTLCFSFNATYPCASCEDAPAPCTGP